MSNHLDTAQIRDSMRISEITRSRTVRYGEGSVTVTMTATATASGGGSLSSWSLEEAALASHLLGLDVDVAAYKQAAAGGIISNMFARDVLQSIRSNYTLLMASLMGVGNE